MMEEYIVEIFGLQEIQNFSTDAVTPAVNLQVRVPEWNSLFVFLLIDNYGFLQCSDVFALGCDLNSWNLEVNLQIFLV